jgi:hypothetical protein
VHFFSDGADPLESACAARGEHPTLESRASCSTCGLVDRLVCDPAGVMADPAFSVELCEVPRAPFDLDIASAPTRFWWRPGVGFHRVGEPAVVDAQGQMEWFFDGQLHRDEGLPARDGDPQEWWVDGLRHREAGPALTWSGGRHREWWLEGTKVTALKAYHRWLEGKLATTFSNSGAIDFFVTTEGIDPERAETWTVPSEGVVAIADAMFPRFP